ncbi:unnamed protein product [Rhodiola kirilowii]
MTAIIQGIGAAKAISSPVASQISRPGRLVDLFQVSHLLRFGSTIDRLIRVLCSGRRPGAFVVRSDARGSSSSSSSSFFFVFVLRSARADHLITNGVATKADGAAAASTGSKQGYPLDSTAASLQSKVCSLSSKRAELVLGAVIIITIYSFTSLYR